MSALSQRALGFLRRLRAPRPATGSAWDDLQGPFEVIQTRYEAGARTEEERSALRRGASRRCFLAEEDEEATLRRPKKERQRGNVIREEAAMGKSWDLKKDLVSPSAQSQDEIIRQIRAQDRAFLIGTVAGLCLGFLGGLLGMTYILLLLGRIKL